MIDTKQLKEMLQEEQCSDDFIKIALDHIHLYGGNILNFIESIEKLFAPQDDEETSLCTSVDNLGIKSSEINYNGNTLESGGYHFETDEGRVY